MKIFFCFSTKYVKRYFYMWYIYLCLVHAQNFNPNKSITWEMESWNLTQYISIDGNEVSAQKAQTCFTISTYLLDNL